MFSQFQCCSLSSETTAEASSKVVLEKTCRSKHIKIWSRAWWMSGRNFHLPSAEARQSRLPASWRISCHSTGMPRHSTGPPSPWTRNSYPPQSITGALGLRLRKGERKHIFITVIKCDTFSVWRPRSCISPPSSFLLSRCVFWMAYPRVCCVNVHGNVMHLLHPGAVSNSPYVPPPPSLSSTLAHLGTQHCSESWPGPQLPATLPSCGYSRKAINIATPAGNTPMRLPSV